MNAAHTPGPWVTYKQEDGLYAVRSQSTGHRLAKDLAESDALIFASSLEMLDALYEIGDHSLEFDIDEIRYIARAAIERAQGGNNPRTQARAADQKGV